MQVQEKNCKLRRPCEEKVKRNLEGENILILELVLDFLVYYLCQWTPQLVSFANAS